MVIAFIVVVAVLVYTWLVYPGVVLWLGRSPCVAKAMQGRQSTEELPHLAILFSAHNEESVILQRLENLAALDYPADRIHIFAGIDGGSDRTAEIALAWAQSHPHVHVVVSPENHGKTAMLKRLVESNESRVMSRGTVGGGQGTVQNEVAAGVPAADGRYTDQKSFAGDGERHLRANRARSTGGSRRPRRLMDDSWTQESSAVRLRSRQAGDPPTPRLRWAGVERHLEENLLVFTDANTFFAPDALRRLVAPFADPAVGGVCGRLVLGEQDSGFRIQDSGGTDEATYWNLETRLKAAESALDSCLGANGAIYAIRAGLFPAHFPDNTIIDDFVIGMKVREQGRRLVYEPAAVATEELPATVEAEWRRRVRIGAGAYQALALCWRGLLPRYGAFAWMFWSHKVLRWFTPHLLVVGCGLLVVEVARKSSGASLSSATQQISNLTTPLCLILVAGLVVLLTRQGRKGLQLLAYFMTMQAALFVGFLRFCKGNLRGTWRRTER